METVSRSGGGVGTHGEKVRTGTRDDGGIGSQGNRDDGRGGIRIQEPSSRSHGNCGGGLGGIRIQEPGSKGKGKGKEAVSRNTMTSCDQDDFSEKDLSVQDVGGDHDDDGEEGGDNGDVNVIGDKGGNDDNDGNTSGRRLIRRSGKRLFELCKMSKGGVCKFDDECWNAKLIEKRRNERVKEEEETRVKEFLSYLLSGKFVGALGEGGI